MLELLLTSLDAQHTICSSELKQLLQTQFVIIQETPNSLDGRNQGASVYIDCKKGIAWFCGEVGKFNKDQSDTLYKEIQNQPSINTVYTQETSGECKTPFEPAFRTNL